jgi:hypothetical protein
MQYGVYDMQPYMYDSANIKILQSIARRLVRGWNGIEKSTRKAK